jgi:hypothetical protein
LQNKVVKYNKVISMPQPGSFKITHGKTVFFS